MLELGIKYFVAPGLIKKKNLARQHGLKPVITKRPIYREIIKICCDYFDINPEDITGLKRGSVYITYTRQMTHYLISTRTHLSSVAIGEMLHRDRTTVIHSKKKIEGWIKSDPGVQGDLEVLQEKIENVLKNTK